MEPSKLPPPSLLSFPPDLVCSTLQVSRVNHMTIALATQGEWTSANHTLEGYHDFLQDTEGHVSYLRAQSSLNFLLYNIGRVLIEVSPCSARAQNLVG